MFDRYCTTRSLITSAKEVMFYPSFICLLFSNLHKNDLRGNFTINVPLDKE